MIILYYDKNCPLCVSFAKKIEKKLKARIELKALLGTGAEELFLDYNGHPYMGKEAAKKLLEEFPEIEDFFWILPDRYRKNAALKSYSWSNRIRTWLFHRKQCKRC